MKMILTVHDSMATTKRLGEKFAMYYSGISRVLKPCLNKSSVLLGLTLKNKLAIVIFLLLTGMPAIAANTDIDLHWSWDDRCADCHGHSGDFSREFLSVSRGELQGRHHINDLRLFLHNHYLSDRLVDDMYNMLLAQLSSSTRFKGDCSGCHQNAAVFVRGKLVFDGSILKIRKTGESVSDFLHQHRRLNKEDVIFYTELLTRVAKEVNLR